MKYFLMLIILTSKLTFSQGNEFNWQKITEGVSYTNTEPTVNQNITLCLGGWTVKKEWVETWAENLYQAKLKEQAFGHLYAIKGPDQVFYDSLEIDMIAVVNHFIAVFKRAYELNHAVEIIVIAHSSGSFVAHNFFLHLFKTLPADSKIRKRIRYFNLDGDSGTGHSEIELTENIATNLAKIYAVAAFDKSANIFSPNQNAMLAIDSAFADKSKYIEVLFENTGCTGKWCVHELLINMQPYNPESFDLEKDYNEINSSHPVCTEYLSIER